MPWLNTHLDGWQPGQGALEDFNVYAIPLSFLVGANGMILSVDTGLDERLYDILIAEMER